MVRSLRRERLRHRSRIYVTDGALDACATEAELAAMVAHEMGHQVAGHFCLGTEREAASRRPIGALVQHIEPAKELEADRIAVQILTAAGYYARGALSVATRLAQGRPAERPLDEARIQALSRLLEGKEATGRSDSEEFRRLKRVTAAD